MKISLRKVALSALFAVVIVSGLIILFFSVKSPRQEQTKSKQDAISSNVASPKDGKGTAIIIPDSDITCNSWGTWQIIFTVAETGIDKGGGVAFHISPFWGWTAPQNLDSSMPGYVTVSCSKKTAELDILTSQLNYIVVRLKNTSLIAGDTITVIYGDTQYGKNPGARAKADRYAEHRERFFIKVDGDGDEHFFAIDKPPAINILPGPASRLIVTAPSITKPGHAFLIKVAAVDGLDNRVYSYHGEIDITPLPEGAEASGFPRVVELIEGTNAFEARISKQGIYNFQVLDRKNGLKGISNPILCRENSSKFNLYWGDLHGHSNLSDGTGTPEDYYTYARSVAALDVAALTDHDAHGFEPLDEHEDIWGTIKEHSNRFYEPGKFVTFSGYEWTNWTSGHKHVLFLHTPAQIFSFRNPASDTPEKLWRILKPQNAMTISHHVGGGPIATDWDFFNPEMEPVVEVCSVHGNSEYMGCSTMIYNPKKGSFVQDALARGYPLGIIASGDTHNGHPGMGDPASPASGLAAFYATTLSREGIWNALKNRRVYGTSGERIFINFKINGHWMGEIIKEESGNSRKIDVHIIGTNRLQKVVVVKNNSDFKVWEEKGSVCERTILDTTPASDRDFYYVRVLQANKELAWSSPIWIER